MEMIEKKIFFVFALALLANLSCSRSPEYRLKKYLAENTDSVEIRIYGMRQDELDKNLLVEKVSNINEIKKIIDFISEKPAPSYKCAYHGSIAFLKKDTEIMENRIEFNLHPDCRHMVFIYEKKLYSRDISEAGFKYLDRLYNRIPADARLK
jgi:hypothetical protein